MTSRRASSLFVTSTFFVLAITPALFGRIDAVDPSPAERVFWGVLGVLGTLSLFFIWIGMWRFWMSVDRSSNLARKFWFLVLLVGFWWGSCFYCYFVYWPQVSARAAKG